jgi:hypothetical protein
MQHDTPPDTTSSPHSLLPLKIAVYCMGLMLLGGFIWLGGQLALQAQALNSKACQDITLPAAPQGYRFLHADFSDDYWIVAYRREESLNALNKKNRDANDTPVFRRYDRCGTLKQTLRLPPSASN